MRLIDEVRQAVARLQAAGLEPDEAAIDAEVLARFVLGWDRARYLTRRHEVPPSGFSERYAQLTDRRARREPTAYIVGRREFWDLEFAVTPAVLIPRPETELIIEEAQQLARTWGRAPRHILDAGTGCGCLAVTLARLFPTARVTATDRSPEALAVARQNARCHGVADRIGFVEGSFVPDDVEPPPDLIVSNPPYVPTADLAHLRPEVRDYEPRAALDGGANGLDAIRQLLALARRRLAPDGWVLFEFGSGQEEAVRKLASEQGLAVRHIRADLQGLPRVAAATHAAASILSRPEPER